MREQSVRLENKKTIMAFSAWMILIFHLWIPLFPESGLEAFLKQTAYVGVDLFFFVSGVSLAGAKIENYFQFEYARFRAVYVKFLLWAFAAFLFYNWSIGKCLQVISTVELFRKGGGAFLWFLPVIMIFYLLFPFFQFCHKRKPVLTFFTLLALWSLTGFMVSKYTNYKAMFIFWNRIPVFLCGFYVAVNSKLSNMLEKKTRIAAGLFLTIAGYVLIYFYGYRIRLNTPIVNLFYVIVIPAVLGLVLLLSCIPEIKPVYWLGSSTLEMYGIQMVFGYKLANGIFSASQNKALTNVLVLVLISITAVLLKYAVVKACSIVNNMKKQRKFGRVE